MSWRRAPAGLVSGPRKLKIVRPASSRRTGTTKRVAWWWVGANMKPKPASSMQRATASGPRSIRAPSASSTSAEPDRLVAERLPCLASAQPAPAAISAAVVETLNVGRPPPVPAVSTRSSRSHGTGVASARIVGRARTRRDDHAVEGALQQVVGGCAVVAHDLEVAPQLAQVLDEVVGERVVVVDHEDLHGQSGCSSAISTARSTAFAFASDSANSYSGLASATVPPPAWTCSTMRATIASKRSRGIFDVKLGRARAGVGSTAGTGPASSRRALAIVA